MTNLTRRARVLIGRPILAARLMAARLMAARLMATEFLVAALLSSALWPAPSRAAEGWQPFAAVASAEIGVTGPMRLGLRAEQWRDAGGESTGSGTTARRLPSQCRKWQSMATQLGETFAGYTLRHTVLKRVCDGLGDPQLDETWDWPWAGFASGRMAPPRMVRSIEAWEIRCGRAGARQRCAMLHAEPAATGAPSIVTHFVIDMVAGRESLLWRVFVPAEDNATVPPETMAARASTQGIRYHLKDGWHVERFSKCAAAGCIMEANLLRGGEVATDLWDGNGVGLAITLASGRSIEIALPAQGFRAGLAELVRRRRDEFRAARR